MNYDLLSLKMIYNVFFLFQNSKKLLVRKLESCKGERHLPLIFRNLTVTKNPNTGGYEFEFELVVKKEVSKNLAVSIRFYNLQNTIILNTIIAI